MPYLTITDRLAATCNAAFYRVKSSAIAKMARVNSHHGTVETPILDTNNVDFLWYYDVVVP